MKAPLFSIIPIGGVGEIGSNFTLIKTASGDIIIDCGLLFPYEDFFDINYLIPDFSVIEPEKLVSVVITHGHEDHIGALTHLITKFPQTPIWAGKFTQELIKRKTSEKNITPLFKTYSDKDILDFGQILIHPIAVTHSIPETFGLFICDKDNAWGALYISDFKVDLDPLHEKPFDLEKISNLTKSVQKSIFFIDSTNALVNAKTPSENDLIHDLDHLIGGDEQRLFITLFSSNIHRISNICSLAKKHKRKIVIMGRSVDNYLRAGLVGGFIKDIDETDLFEPAQVKNLETRLLVIVSGCQGDFLSALRRISYGEDSTFKLNENDKVIFSSKVIPGNEKKISRIMNKISEHGSKIATAYDYAIHASGHPGREDLSILLDLIKPDIYIPIHGESFFLVRHSEWVKEKYGLESKVIYNGTSVDLYADLSWKTSIFSNQEPILIHGNGIEIERSQISQRRKMACNGTVFLSVDRKKKIIKLSFQGLPLIVDDLSSKLEKLILSKITGDLSGRKNDYTEEQLRIAVRQFFKSNLGYKPVSIVHLIE
jgi:ribonuclease J